MAIFCAARRHSFGVVCRLLGLISVLCAGAQVDAADKRWSNMFGGAFNAAANWTGGVPGSADIAEFGVATLFTPGTYTVDFDVSPTNQAIHVEDDIVTFDLNGHTYTTTATTGNEIGSVVGQEGRLTITDGIWNLPISSGISPVIEVGAVAGATGTLIASTGGQIQGTDLVIGAAGAGALTVQNGGDIFTKQTSIGFAAASTATITGAGSTLINNTNLSVRQNSTMTVSLGGLVQNTGGSTSGTVTVTDSNSRWINTQDLFLGGAGTQLTIANGGRVDSENGWVGFAAEGGQAIVGDASPGGSLVSQWINSGLNGGTFAVGASKILVHGSGTLEIRANGRVQDVEGTVAIGANSMGVVTLTSPSAQWLNSGKLTVGDGGNGSLQMVAGTVQNVDGIVGDKAAAVGTVNMNGPNSQWTNTGSLLVGNFGHGTVNVTGGGHLNSGNSVIGVEMGSVGEVTVEGPNSTWNSSGLILVSSFAPGTGTLTVRDGGTVTATGGVAVRVLGTLRGDGQINGNVGSVGIVAPGTSPGALHIAGNYTQGASGKLDIDLGGTTAGSQYDQLLVSGSATLAGTLDVSLIDGFTPSIGNVFEVVHANGGVLGGFPTLSLPTIPNGMAWTIVYTGVAVFLNVQSGPLLGDYNNNGTVDAADYIVWRNSEGTMTSLPNDGGLGGTIGPAHYNLWRSHFGDARGSGAALGATGSASAGVPEPTTIVLLLIAAVMCWPGGRQFKTRRNSMVWVGRQNMCRSSLTLRTQRRRLITECGPPRVGWSACSATSRRSNQYESFGKCF